MASSHDAWKKHLFRLLYIGYKDLWSLQVVAKELKIDQIQMHLGSFDLKKSLGDVRRSFIWCRSFPFPTIVGNPDPSLKRKKLRVFCGGWWGRGAHHGPRSRVLLRVIWEVSIPNWAVWLLRYRYGISIPIFHPFPISVHFPSDFYRGFPGEKPTQGKVPIGHLDSDLGWES